MLKGTTKCPQRNSSFEDIFKAGTTLVGILPCMY